MAPKWMLLAATLCAVALAGCTAGDDSGDDGTSETTTTSGGVGVGGNATVGNTTLSGSYSATGTGNPGNATNTTAPLTESVSIEGMSYVNSTVTVRVGGTVTWTHNDGTTPHTVTGDDGSFDSSPDCAPTVGPLPPTGDCMTSGDTFAVTFATAGSYTYHCKVHGSTMTGTVNVVA